MHWQYIQLYLHINQDMEGSSIIHCLSRSLIDVKSWTTSDVLIEQKNKKKYTSDSLEQRKVLFTAFSVTFCAVVVARLAANQLKNVYVNSV